MVFYRHHKILLMWLFLFIQVQAWGQTFEEMYRPQFHFSPKRNWVNDPCGMVYLDGEYHLMYQYNPYGSQWGNMSWGHAVSKDLIHWEELPVALFPDNLGAIFSGGSVVDKANTAGFGESAIIAIYTSAGHQQTQSIAYSTDKGKIWKKYSGNPVLPNQGIVDFRDPQVFWHHETGRWIMTLAVFDRIEIYSSPDLKEWSFESDFGRGLGAHGGVWECPDLFKLKVNETSDSLWVMMVSLNPGSPSGGSGTQYFLGNFDGKRFTLTEEFDAFLNMEDKLPEGVLFEDFEGENYGDWIVEGDAFGQKPVEGTLPHQQTVSGFRGKQLVNSYLNGDITQGSLTSPVFEIQHDYINFLIGGGNHPGKTEIRLRIDGEIIASATGRNQERLIWRHWNVKQYKGKEARIEIVDYESGGWGHINIDHIYFSDTAIDIETEKAFWVDYGPDFYAGRSWENMPADQYQRVWLAWINNWAYAGALPTHPWRGEMSLPRYLELKETENGKVRLVQKPVKELELLRKETVFYEDSSIKKINELIQNDNIEGSRFEMSFTLKPGKAFERSGVEVLKINSYKTVIGYDPEINAVFLDRSASGRNFSGNYEKVFYAPLGQDYEELNFRIFVDESVIEVYVNEGLYVQTARVFVWSDQARQIAFLGAEDAEIKSFHFWQMKSVWHKEGEVTSNAKEEISFLKVYPNPSKGVFKVKSIDEVESFRLYTITGQQVPVTVLRETNDVHVIAPGNNIRGLMLLNIHLRNGKILVHKVVRE